MAASVLRPDERARISLSARFGKENEQRLPEERVRGERGPADHLHEAGESQQVPEAEGEEEEAEAAGLKEETTRLDADAPNEVTPTRSRTMAGVSERHEVPAHAQVQVGGAGVGRLASSLVD